MEEHSHEHHTHNHEGGHVHDHSHGHDHGAGEGPASREELLALLSYMVSHNKHHAAELAELAQNMDGAAADALQKAILSFSEGNEQLEHALNLMQEDQ